MISQLLALADSAGVPRYLYTRFPDASVASLVAADRIHECPVAPVPIEATRLRAIHLRRTVVRRPGTVEARRVRVEGVVQIVAHEQIEPSIPIDVDERGGNAPGGPIAGSGS